MLGRDGSGSALPRQHSAALSASSGAIRLGSTLR